MLPPGRTLNLHLPFNSLKNHNLTVFFLRNFNTHHTSLGSSCSNASGRNLLTILRRYNFEHLGPNFFTFFNSRSKSTPDIILRNSHATHLNYFASSGPLLLSDHRPILLTISPSPLSSCFITASLYNLKSQGNMMQPCLTPLSILKHSLSPPFTPMHARL